MLGCQFEDPGRQLPRRQTAEVPFDGRTEVSCWVCDAHSLGAAADQIGLALRSRLKPDGLAAKEDFCSHQPGLRLARPQRLPQKLTFEGDTVTRKCPGPPSTSPLTRLSESETVAPVLPS